MLIGMFVVYACVELWIPVKTPLLLLRIRVAHNFWCIAYRAISLEREGHNFEHQGSPLVRCVCLSQFLFLLFKGF